MDTVENNNEEKVIKVNEQNDGLSMSNFGSDELEQIGGANANEDLDTLLNINNVEKENVIPKMDSIMPDETTTDGIKNENLSQKVDESSDMSIESVSSNISTAESEIKNEANTSEFLKENNVLNNLEMAQEKIDTEDNLSEQSISTLSDESQTNELKSEEVKEEKPKKKGFFASLFGKKEKKQEETKAEETEKSKEESEDSNNLMMSNLEDVRQESVTEEKKQDAALFLSENESINNLEMSQEKNDTEDNLSEQSISTLSDESQTNESKSEEVKEEKPKKKGFLASLFGKKEKKQEEAKAEEIEKINEEKLDTFVSTKEEDASLPEVPEIYSWDSKEDRAKYITWLSNDSIKHPENEQGNNSIIAKLKRYGELVDGEVYEEKESIVLEPSKKVEEEPVVDSNIDSYNYTQQASEENMVQDNKGGIQISEFSVDTPEARAEYIKELEKDTLENPDHAIANQNKINFIKSFGEVGIENEDENTKTI